MAILSLRECIASIGQSFMLSQALGSTLMVVKIPLTNQRMASCSKSTETVRTAPLQRSGPLVVAWQSSQMLPLARQQMLSLELTDCWVPTLSWFTIPMAIVLLVLFRIWILKQHLPFSGRGCFGIRPQQLLVLLLLRVTVFSLKVQQLAKGRVASNSRLKWSPCPLCWLFNSLIYRFIFLTKLRRTSISLSYTGLVLMVADFLTSRVLQGMMKLTSMFPASSMAILEASWLFSRKYSQSSSMSGQIPRRVSGTFSFMI